MIIGAMLVRNEAGRYLERVLEQMNKVCDRIIVLDDASTDDTVEICKRYGGEVWECYKSNFPTDELYLRQSLWSYATDIIDSGDWILCLDADETIPDIERLPKAIKAAEQHKADAIGFRLYDMWSETEYRDDKHWMAHKKLWPMCVRYDAGKSYIWSDKKLHCGRFPMNAVSCIADVNLDIQHWGWSREADRLRKYEFYKRIDTAGLGIQAQYGSILDEHPTLKKYGAKRVLIASPVHQTEQIFKLYLDSLDSLDTTGLEVDWAFIFHNCPELVQIAKSYTNRRLMMDCLTEDVVYQRDAETHRWEMNNFHAVVRMRNSLLFAAKHDEYDHLFMVDSDLILHPQTLQQLIKADKPIVSNVFWTKWQPDSIPMPNAWMADHYTFDTYDRLSEWREPGLYQVGMTGACTLIRRDVIEAGVNYSPIPNVSFTKWEDRAFCIRASVHGFDIWMDTTYPAKHLYRDSDVQEVLQT